MLTYMLAMIYIILSELNQKMQMASSHRPWVNCERSMYIQEKSGFLYSAEIPLKCS